MWCPSCGDEFREGVTHCPDCGVELVSDEAVPRPTAPPKREIPEGYEPLPGVWEDPPDEFVEWLDDEGIPVLQVHERDGVVLYVPKSELARAELLLSDFHDEDEEEGEAEDEYEEVDVEFELEDLSARSRDLLRDGDLDTFGMLADGDERDMLDLADRLEEAGVPVLVVDVDDDVMEIHVPERCRRQAEAVTPEDHTTS